MMPQGRWRRSRGGVLVPGIPTDGLDVQWTMDNISGSTLVDDMGNANGTITGATAVAGHVSNALRFADSTHVVTSTLYPSAIKTFSFWLVSTNSGVINIIYENGPNTNSTANSFVLYTDANSSPAINYSKTSGTVVVCTLATPVNVMNGVYHHVRLMINSGITTTAQVRIWVDDVERTVSYAGTRTTFTMTARTTYMGQRSGGAARLIGDLDQWREYNRNLDSAEGTQLYNEAA